MFLRWKQIGVVFSCERYWFAVFHRQSSLGLLQRLLYLEVCESRSASGIELKITTFRKSLLCFSFCATLLRTRRLLLRRLRLLMSIGVAVVLLTYVWKPSLTLYTHSCIHKYFIGPPRSKNFPNSLFQFDFLFI